MVVTPFAHIFSSPQGTKVERVINDLFEGTLYNFIQCCNVDFKSDRKEPFQARGSRSATAIGVAVTADGCALCTRFGDASFSFAPRAGHQRDGEGVQGRVRQL